MLISAIVAVSQNGIIGRNGKLPWSLPADLKHFKELTSSHPIVMGRKTFESIGRPLPGRKNIILTRDKGYQAEGCTIVNSLDEAIKAAGEADEVFIIGGSNIYELAMPMTDKVYLTRVFADVNGDSRYDFDGTDWKIVDREFHKADSENLYAFEFQEWIRK